MIEWLDRFLNRIVLLLLGVLVMTAIFKAMEDPPRPGNIRDLALDTNGLLGIMNTSCPGVSETLAYLRSCIEVPDGETSTDCPIEQPAWVTYRPASTALADMIIEHLEQRQQSAECRSVRTDPFNGLTQEQRDMSWSELQQNILETEAAIEAEQENETDEPN